MLKRGGRFQLVVLDVLGVLFVAMFGGHVGGVHTENRVGMGHGETLAYRERW